MNIGFWLIIIIGGAVGFFSTMYIVVSLIAVIFYKAYRKMRYGISMFR